MWGPIDILITFCDQWTMVDNKKKMPLYDKLFYKVF